MFFQCSRSNNNVSAQQNLTWRGQHTCPMELCTQLENLLHENRCSPEEHDRQCVKQLRSISAWIRDHHPSNEELVYIGGRGSCVLRCLAEAATSGRWRVATAALQCLHEISDHLPLTGTGVSKASTVAAGVQQEVTRLLQLHQQSPSIGHGEAVCLALRVSHALLLLAPASLLPATFLAACRPYLFYGLPSYRSAVQDYSGGSLLQEQLDSLQSSECDQAAMARPNYNNRNRRKRLRRKKTQPGSTVSKSIPKASPFSLSEDLQRTQRGSSVFSRRVPPLFTSTGDEEQSPAKTGIIGDRRSQPEDGLSSTSHSAAMPLQLRPPDPSELNNLCLKPQWAMNRDRKKTSLNATINETKKDEQSNGVSSEIIGKPQAVEPTVTLRVDGEGRFRNPIDNSVSSACKIKTPFEEENGRNSTDDLIASSIISKPRHSKSDIISIDMNSEQFNKEMFVNGSTKHINLESAEDLKSNSVQDDLHVSGKNQNKSFSCYEIIGFKEMEISQSVNDNNRSSQPCTSSATTITAVGGHNSSINRASSHHFRPDDIKTLDVDHESNKNNNSSSDEDEAGEQRVWSRSLLTARVRQSALAAVSALVTVAGPAGKMSLWVPLMCQSPSLLHSLLTEPQVPGRAAILALLSLLLTDARQPLAAATDRTDHTAYSSLCHQLGSSLREMHGALGRVLVYERSSDAIVRTLKVLELLLGNVTYSKLAPGLLSGVVRMVRPYVSHSEAVVRANALSVLVSVLLVKPALAEVPEMLLRYSPPGPRTNSTSAMSSEDVLAHFTASSEDTAAEWEVEEEVLDEYSEPENVAVLSNFEALNLKMFSTNVHIEADCSTAASNQPQPPTQSRPNNSSSRRTLLGWLVGQCVDALLPPPPSPHGHGGSTRGVYVQVQLQSLKVLHALVTDHFSLVYSRLPVLQRVISHGCRAPPTCGGLADIAESGVVVEHMFPLLAAVLGVLKKECDSLLKTDTSEAEGGLGHHSCLLRREEECWDGRLGLGVIAQFKAGGLTPSNASQEEDGGLSSIGGARRSSGRRRDRELGGAVNLSDISWLPLATSLWQWALQDPLRDLLLLPVVAAATAKSIEGSGCGEGGQWSIQIDGKKDLGISSEAHCDDRVSNENRKGSIACPVNVAEGKNDLVREDVPEGAMTWYRALQGTGETAEGARRQLVVAANTLSLLSQQVAEDIGEQHLSSVLATVLWLTNERQPEMVAVWGVRVVGALCSLPAVQRSPLALDVVTSAVVAGTRLLQDSAGPAASGAIVGTRSEPLVLEFVACETEIIPGRSTGVAQCVANEQQQQQQTAAAVNKHRLVAVSALANIAASLKHYSPRLQEGEVLPRYVTECLLEAAIVACDDKSKIRPHGVRCLGSALGWLREVAFEETLKGDPLFGHSPSQAITWLELSPVLCQRALATLIECCSNGNNMKMRWNACHALGHLLHCPLPIAGSQEWRGPVLTLLCSLVSSFPNFKVRIQACLALCGLPARELYGAHYRSAWRALLAAATSSRNVTDYLEMRHLDDLVCQVVKGAWQLTALATAGDCAWLQPLLLENMASLTLLLRRARSCLPPNCCVAQERALQRVAALMDGSDALTDDEVAGLRLLASLFGDGPLSLPDDQVTAALLDGGTAFLATPSTKTLP